jgi:hypothetical protein
MSSPTDLIVFCEIGSVSTGAPTTHGNDRDIQRLDRASSPRPDIAALAGQAPAGRHRQTWYTATPAVAGEPRGRKREGERNAAVPGDEIAL